MRWMRCMALPEEDDLAAGGRDRDDELVDAGGARRVALVGVLPQHAQRVDLHGEQDVVSGLAPDLAAPQLYECAVAVNPQAVQRLAVELQRRDLLARAAVDRDQLAVAGDRQQRLGRDRDVAVDRSAPEWNGPHDAAVRRVDRADRAVGATEEQRTLLREHTRRQTGARAQHADRLAADGVEDEHATVGRADVDLPAIDRLRAGGAAAG